MSGRLECRVGNQDLTLLRTTRRANAPLGEFQATYTGTGDPVPGLTGPTCGELLLGVSREVYERSAFIRQSGLAISQDARSGAAGLPLSLPPAKRIRPFPKPQMP